MVVCAFSAGHLLVELLDDNVLEGGLFYTQARDEVFTTTKLKLKSSYHSGRSCNRFCRSVTIS